MSTAVAMGDFPSTGDRLVTKANWMRSPFNKWGFYNVRRLLPTANIVRSSTPVKLARQPLDLSHVEFEGIEGTSVLLRDSLELLDVDGVVVLHKGKIVWEAYDHGFGPGMQHICFSVTKPVTATLAGILIDLGRFDANDLVMKYIPEAKGTAYDSARIRHLLDMSVGITYSEDYQDPTSDFPSYMRAAGWIPSNGGKFEEEHLRHFLMRLKPDGAVHGNAFHYVSPNTDVLGWICERAAGAHYSELLSRHIWAPMGAEDDAYIALDSHGAGRMAGGLCATIYDLAKFGEVLRNNGVANNGNQVVPKWWIDDIRRNGNAEVWDRSEFTGFLPRGNYRNKWYIPDRDRSAFTGIGIYGQYIYVDPEDEMIVARFSSQTTPFKIPNDHMWMRACRAIGAQLRRHTVQ